MSWMPAATVASLLPGPLARPRHRDLTARLAQLISDGRLRSGTRLPSERDLAAALGVSRTTTTAAYRALVERQLLHTRQGAGTFISERPAPAQSPLLPTPFPDADGCIGLTTTGEPALPETVAAYGRAIERLPEITGGIGYFPDGLPELRAAIARRYRERGVATTPDQIIVTTGALSALHIVARTLSEPGHALITESVGYGNALRMLSAVSALTTFDMSADGWNLASLAEVLRRGPAAAVFVTADFHNPTGRLMDDATRAQLAAMARAAGAPVVTDESLVDLSMPWAPSARPLAAHDPAVISVGSAAKSYWGGLRIGWIRAPEAMVEPLLRERTVSDHGAAAFEQLVLTELLTDPDAARAGRDRIRRQLPILMALVGDQLPEWRFRRPDGGQNLWLELDGEWSTRICQLAADRGLLLTPGPHFFAHPGGERWLRLPATAPPEILADAVRRLADADAVKHRGSARPAAPGFTPLSA